MAPYLDQAESFHDRPCLSAFIHAILAPELVARMLAATSAALGVDYSDEPEVYVSSHVEMNALSKPTVGML